MAILQLPLEKFINGFNYFGQSISAQVKGQWFYSDNELIVENNEYFGDMDKSFYLEGINKLKHCWTKG